MSAVDFQWVAEPLLPASITCRSLPPVWGQKCLEVSTVRGRRVVGGMGSGGTGGGALGYAASCSHRAQGGWCVRPANGWGPVERWRCGVMGLAGFVWVVTPWLG